MGQTKRAEMISTRPIDTEHLGRYTLGDRELEAEVLDLFLGQIPQILGRMAPGGDATDWSEAAHTLKGSARAVGAWRLAHLAEQAERLPGGEAERGALRRALAEAADEVRVFMASEFGQRPVAAA